MHRDIEGIIQRFLIFAGECNLTVVSRKELNGSTQLTVVDGGGVRIYIQFTLKKRVVVQGKDCETRKAIEKWADSQTRQQIAPTVKSPSNPMPRAITYKSDNHTSAQIFDRLHWQFLNEIERVDRIEPTDLDVFRICRAGEEVLVKRTNNCLVLFGTGGPVFQEIDNALRRDMQEAISFEPASRRMRGIFITDPVFHRDATHFRYRETNMYWEGPRKKAIEALQKAGSMEVMKPEQYLDILRRHYPEYYEDLEWITFYRYPWRMFSPDESHRLLGEIELRLAVTHLKPTPQTRDGMYADREAITVLTGWYPLVQGSKAWVSKPPYHRHLEQMQNTDGLSLQLGSLANVRGTGGPDDGNCLVIEGTTGKIMLDTGFKGWPEPVENLQAVFVSHFHKDHSGGLNHVLAENNVPVILSEPTLSYLWYSDRISYEAKKKIVNAAHVIELAQTKITGDISVKFFPVFHAPGSCGIEITDNSGCKVYYLGDVCLRNGFMNPSNEMLENILKGGSGSNARKFVILDATMIKKEAYTIAEEDRPNAVIKEQLSTALKRDMVFVSDGPETLIYSFVLAFTLTRSHDESITKIILNDDVYKFTRRMIRPVLLKKPDEMDPFISHLIGDRMINFIESHRVYPISSLRHFDKGENVAIFATSDDIANDPILRSRVSRSDVAIIGPLALRENIPPEVVSCGPRITWRIASPDWSFHSDTDDLAAFIRTLNKHQIRTILFHTFPKNILRFIQDKNLDPAMVFPITRNGIVLH